MAEKVLLVDGHSILNRAFYAIPEMTDSSGRHTNAVYGFLNILFRILEQEQPTHLAVAFDRREPTFRHEMYAEYKGTRRPMPPELHEQVPMLKELIAAFGIPVLEQPGYEADDILGTVGRLAAESGREAVLLSGDRDLLQLAAEGVRICLARSKKGQTVYEDFTPEKVLEVYGVTPEEFIELKALMGDSSDNIPGVPGIGEKTGTALIAQYHSVQGVYEHLEEVRPPRAKTALAEHRDLAELSLKLARICREAPVAFDEEAFRVGDIFTPEAYELMKGMELRTLLRRFSDRGTADRIRPAAEEASVRTITDREEALSWLDTVAEGMKKAADEGAPAVLAVQVIPSQEPDALAVCCRKGETVLLQTGKGLGFDDLSGPLSGLAKSASTAAAANLKAVLKCLDLREEDGWKDAAVAAYLLNPLQNSYGCDDLARDWLKRTVLSEKEVLEKKKREEVTPQDRETLAGNAAGVTHDVIPVLLEELDRTGMRKLYEEIEMPLLFSLDRMEKAGVYVRREALAAYGASMTERIAALEQAIHEQTGEVFNINSPKQLGEVLFEKMALPGGKKTKTGYSTSAEVLEKLAPFVPAVGLILEYRTLTKLKSTYADGLAPYIGEDGRIHGTFHQTVTATGRISSADPNLQNIPVRTEAGREIRAMFEPAEGCVFVDADYSQIELRILAAMSGDERLIAAYREARDIHAITASEVFHVPLDEVTPELRRNAKAVNFGIVYGISSFGLSEGLSISRQEAAEYIRQYFRTYPQVKAFLDRQVQEARENGFVTTLFGRRRPVPELKSSNFNIRSFGERVAMNSPIQGTAADIMKLAMIRTDRALKEAGLKTRIVLQIHDELLLEAPKEEAEQAGQILQEAMSRAAELTVPLAVEVHQGSTWKEAKG